MTGFDPEYEEGLDWFEEQPDRADLADVLRCSLHDDYADASEEIIDEALAEVLDSMSPAESLSVAGALSQIGRAPVTSCPTRRSGRSHAVRCRWRVVLSVRWPAGRLALCWAPDLALPPLARCLPARRARLR